VGVMSSIGVILGRGAIMPIVNTASGCWVLLYFLVAFGIIWMRRMRPDQIRPYRIPGGLTIPVLAAAASLFMLFESFYLPYANNRSRIPVEWILFVGWGLLGVLFWSFGSKSRGEVSEQKRRALILGESDLQLTKSEFSPSPTTRSHNEGVDGPHSRKVRR
jgi:basic amino acid/polyamine antiporter, APA family